MEYHSGRLGISLLTGDEYMSYWCCVTTIKSDLDVQVAVGAKDAELCITEYNSSTHTQLQSGKPKMRLQDSKWRGILSMMRLRLWLPASRPCITATL
jgi:hypothetical protein